MSYATESQKKTANNVVELVIFRTGPNSYLYSTTHDKALTINNQVGEPITYDPFPFDRGERKVSTAFDDDSIKIVVNPDHPICEHYRNFPTNYDVSVIVRQGYLQDNGQPFTANFNDDYPVFIMGWVGACELNAEDGTMTISVVTIGDTLAAPSLARMFQQSCPLRLYGPKCRAAQKTVSLTPATVVNGTISLPVNWNGAYLTPDFIGGLIAFTMPSGVTEYRMVSQTTATTIRFVGSTVNLEGYTAISVSLGCKHTLDDCRNLHENSRRYGGFPFMPLDNPVNKSIR